VFPCIVASRCHTRNGGNDPEEEGLMRVPSTFVLVALTSLFGFGCGGSHEEPKTADEAAAEEAEGVADTADEAADKADEAADKADDTANEADQKADEAVERAEETAP
jgi:hypothetical protein